MYRKAAELQRADRAENVIRLKALNQKASLEPNYRKAVGIYHQGIALGEKIGGDPKPLAKTYFGLATEQRSKRKFPQAETNYKNALDSYRKNEDLRGVKKVESVLENLAQERNTLGNRILKKVGFATAIIGFLGSVFFMTNNFTGYAIAEIDQQSSSLFSVVLFFIGIVGLYFFINKK